jgi:hypothetical protein
MSRSSTAAHATGRFGRAPSGRQVRLVVGLGGLALVAAACITVPPPPPPQPVSQYCGPATATNAPGYQSVFLALRRTYTEWVSGDGAIPVDLPDGRRVFLFSDTYVGTTNGADGISTNDRLVRNSFVVQDGPCFTPLMGGVPHARTALIPDPAPNEWYWPASGVVENGSTLRVIVWHLHTGSGGPLNFVPLDMRVATFALPSLALESVEPLPIPTGGARPYGATILAAPDGYFYLYGRDSNRDQFVARVQQGQLVSGPYQFWGDFPGSGPQWQSDPTLAVPLVVNNVPPLLPQLGTGTGPAAGLWVAPYQGGYLATAKPADLFSDTVSVFTALHPEGPWTWQEDVAVTPPSATSGVPNAAGLAAYGAYTLTPSGNPIVVYSTNQNPFDPNPPPLTIDDYGPQFASPSAPLPTIP